MCLWPVQAQGYVCRYSVYIATISQITLLYGGLTLMQSPLKMFPLASSSQQPQDCSVACITAYRALNVHAVMVRWWYSRGCSDVVSGGKWFKRSWYIYLQGPSALKEFFWTPCSWRQRHQVPQNVGEHPPNDTVWHPRPLECSDVQVFMCQLLVPPSNLPLLQQMNIWLYSMRETYVNITCSLCFVGRDQIKLCDFSIYIYIHKCVCVCVVRVDGCVWCVCVNLFQVTRP